MPLKVRQVQIQAQSYTTLSKVLGHPSKSVNLGVLITAMATDVLNQEHRHEAASTNIWETACLCQELSELKHVAVIS